MPDTTVRIPAWADPNNASVLDNWWTRTARTLGGFLGANDPTAQAMAIGAPVELPSPGQGAAKMTLKAYHGSPHDFDQFSLGKIGTGEGGQAYGHGLYFAENPAVSETYRGGVSPTGQSSRFPLRINGKTFIDAPSLLENLSGSTDPASASYSGARKAFQSWIMGAKHHVSEPESETFLRASDALKRAELVPGGHMYEVNLHASPDELLDWDKPLSQQSPKVQEALKKVGGEDLTKPNPLMAASPSLSQRGLTGADVYQRLVSKIGRAGHTEGTVSQQLKDAGIKGIQYLDQGSRAAGEGTKNFVIFDDKIIEIAKKYGISLPVAASLYKWQQSQKGQ